MNWSKIKKILGKIADVMIWGREKGLWTKKPGL